MVDRVLMESTATLVRVWRVTVEITVKRVSFEFSTLRMKLILQDIVIGINVKIYH